MRYYALATDYDGTLAHDGRVDPPTLEALQRLRASGRKAILVTGRELDELLEVFPEIQLFDSVVAENGALLYNPQTREERPLGKRPPEELADTLRRRGVERVSVGRVIVATWVPHEVTVLETIRDLRLDAQVIFNKGAVMVLPSGVNKATGLKEALCGLGLSPHNVVGVGDAENDLAFLEFCECSVAVSNALTRVKQTADWVTHGDHGVGVVELIDQLVENDLEPLAPRLERHEVVLGIAADHRDVRLPPYGRNLLVCGSLGGGKSTFTTAFLERLVEQKYQFCLLDPEGDYEGFENAVMLGSGKRGPEADEILKLLEKPDSNAVVNLLGIALDHRPAFFEKLLPALVELRARTGRPHWIIVDETHHLVPAEWGRTGQLSPGGLNGLMLVTAFPDRVGKPMLPLLDLVVAVGEEPDRSMHDIAGLLERSLPAAPRDRPADAVLAWRLESGELSWFRATQPRMTRRRHYRKYAEGELEPHVSFYFRGPDNKLNLRVTNLNLFVHMADGVGDEVWDFHRRQHDYSRWFREVIHDEELAAVAESAESDDRLPAEESRQLIRSKIEERYMV